jgi:hypothetical protein
VADLRAKFMKILKVELEDLLEDVDIAEHRIRERFTRREVSDYVFWQNDALFRGEVECLRLLLDRLQSFDCACYADLDALVKAIDAHVQDLVRDHERPEAVCRFVSRKMQKVRSYLESGIEL